jgi:hypothetical protein
MREADPSGLTDDPWRKILDARRQQVRVAEGRDPNTSAGNRSPVKLRLL